MPFSSLVTVAVPPARDIRPTIDSRTPRRPSGTSAASKPGPWSRTNTSMAPGVASTNTVTSPPACRAALSIASRAAPLSDALAMPATSPAVMTSMRTAYSSSSSAANVRSSAARSCANGSVPANSQSRSSRSCARAMRATSLCAPARFWMSASVCSTESCRWAAISARCSSRTRAARSPPSSVQSVTMRGMIRMPTPMMMRKTATTATAGPPLLEQQQGALDDEDHGGGRRGWRDPPVATAGRRDPSARVHHTASAANTALSMTPGMSGPAKPVTWNQTASAAASTESATKMMATGTARVTPGSSGASRAPAA